LESSPARRFFVDSDGGDDSRSGDAPQDCWRTLEKLNEQDFQPGDELLLKRGARWLGTLKPRGSGSAEAPIRIGAYGDGDRPAIDGGASPALLLEDVEGWEVAGLDLTNRKDSGKDALKVRAAKRQPRYRRILIRDCVARGAGGSGIHVGEDEGGNLDDVAIEDCVAFDNQDSGIFIQGSYFDRVERLSIARSTAYGNGWDGIKIYSGRDGVIEDCIAYGNGWKEDARVGIWCWNSERVTIQRCESYRNVTPGTQDGGGFDIDWSCKDCVIQFCYSHDNDGAGYLFMGAGENGKTTGSSVRFNVSQNDGLRNRYGGIVCYGKLQDSSVHNNAVYFSGAADGAAIQFRGDAKALYPQNVAVFNNVVVVSGRRVALRVPAAAAANAFDHNLYFAPAGLVLEWGDVRFAALEPFRAAAGQERRGLAADPLLRGPGLAAAGRRPLEEYRPLPGSPCFGTGRRFPGIESALDYWGASLAGASGAAIGPAGSSLPWPSTQR
jgi:hypothetical protein